LDPKLFRLEVNYLRVGDPLLWELFICKLEEDMKSNGL
jgi:hypothetical protein